jgi:hypothetical protein
MRRRSPAVPQHDLVRRAQPLIVYVIADQEALIAMSAPVGVADGVVEAEGESFDAASVAREGVGAWLCP